MASSMGGNSGSRVVPLGSGQRSSNSALGIEKRVEAGSAGSRESIAASKYGGDRKQGNLFEGASAGSPSPEMNSGRSQKNSSGADEYKDFSRWQGSSGSRENMTLGGGSNKGLGGVGKGANKTNRTGQGNESYVRPPKSQPGMDAMTGTADARKQMGRSLKGIGKRGGPKE